MPINPDRRRDLIRFLGSVLLAFVSASPALSQSDFLDRLVREIKPDVADRPERVQASIDAYQQAFGNDPRLFCFDINSEVDDNNTVRLTGFVEISEMKAGVVKFLERLGYTVVDAIQELPANDLGQHNLGIVKTAHSLSYDRPVGERSVVTDCLLGDALYLLRDQQDHLLVHSQEGYLGYVSSADVLRVDSETFEEYAAAPSVRITRKHKIDSGLTLPIGARLKRIDTQGDTVKIELPTGEQASIPANHCEVHVDQEMQIERVIKNGRKFLGTQYLWGGKTSEGIDCSGLVQVAFYSTGINLPRDSNQQFLLGTLTATRWHRSGMRRGDTLYFLGPYGRIRHTAIYLGGDRYLQAEMPVVDIRSFNPDHEDFDPRRAASFAFAKRLLD